MEKNRRKRWMAGAMAFVMCCTTRFSAGTSAATAETDGVYQEQVQTEQQTEIQTEVQTEMQTEKSEEELIREIEADPAFALTIVAGTSFEIKTDFTGLNLKETDKAELKKAAMEDGMEFNPDNPGVYKCVYKVTTAEGEAYLLARNITVTPREAETSGAQTNGADDAGNDGEDDGEADSETPPEIEAEVVTKPAAESVAETESLSETQIVSVEEPVTELAETEYFEVTEAETEDVTEAWAETETQNLTENVEEAGSETENLTGEQETEMSEAFDVQTELPQETTDSEAEESEVQTESPALSETELDAALLDAEQQDTYDEESGLTLGEVMEQAQEQEVDILALEEGETMTFSVEAPMLLAASSSKSVDITRGSVYYYADYGLGTYETYPYTVKFGSVKATAYCIQPSKAGPGDGTYKITKLGDSKNLAKVCYYGTKAAGDEGFFAEKHPDFSAGKRFVITHLAAAYASGNSDAFSGANSTGQSLAMELYNYSLSQPEIPDVDMSFSEADTTAYLDGEIQRTKEITFKADALQSVTMKLPDGVQLHNTKTGKTSKAGADVEIFGGTTFYLSAPLTQAEEVGASWSSTMKGSITKDYSAYKITTGSSTQNLALVFGEGVDDEKYVDFKVNWIEQSVVEIVKRDKESNAAIAGAVYGIYSDEACQNLLVEMPATDANGYSSVKLTKTAEIVYLKEISVPARYVLDTKAYNITLVTSGTTTQEVTDEDQKRGYSFCKRKGPDRSRHHY